MVTDSDLHKIAEQLVPDDIKDLMILATENIWLAAFKPKSKFFFRDNSTPVQIIADNVLRSLKVDMSERLDLNGY